MSYHTKPETVKHLKAMAAMGFSIRDIASILKISKVTVGRYGLTVPRPDNVSDSAEHKCNLKRKRYLNCGYCSKWFLDKNGEKTSDLKHGRIKRAYCTHRCAMNFRSAARADDKCKRCKKTRRELAHYCFEGYAATSVCFVKGHCPHCYALLRQYGKDENLVKTHELTQTLKENINDERKKHSRPAETVTGSNRRSKKGKSRPSPSTGNKRFEFANFAIS